MGKYLSTTGPVNVKKINLKMQKLFFYFLHEEKGKKNVWFEG